MRRLPLLGLAALALAGCGGGAGARDDVRAVAESFQSAIRTDDGAAACGLLSAALAQEIESQEGEPCRDAIGALDLGGDRVASTDAYQTSGIATLTAGSVHYLGQTPAGWRLDALGCVDEGDPATMPRDCEVEA
jgi:hypothetical protein